jgi:hypothetical protein
MGKKRLGRGFNDISDIFLSTPMDKNKIGGFSSEKLRNETCESCARLISNSNKAPKCKIFTFENKKYGVRYMDTISLTSGSYCRYFEPVFKENTGSRFGVKGTSENTAEINCEIEENVIVRKNIAYPNTPYAQQDILNSLTRHLEENYSLKRVELSKTDRISRPGMEKNIEERIAIYIYGDFRKP